MSLAIDRSQNISLTRGDTARLTVSVTNDATGDAYELAEGDVLALTIKKSASKADAVLSKTLEGASTFVIDPEDTSGLAYGRYKYDVQLTTASGEVYTVVGPATFALTEEITW